MSWRQRLRGQDSRLGKILILLPADGRLWVAFLVFVGNQLGDICGISMVKEWNICLR